MKNSTTRDWLIYSAIIVGLAAAAVYLWPVLSALFAMLSLQLGRTLFWVQFVVLDYLLPDIIIGSLLRLSGSLAPPASELVFSISAVSPTLAVLFAWYDFWTISVFMEGILA